MNTLGLFITVICIVVAIIIPYLVGTLVSEYPADTYKEKVQTWATGMIVIIAFQYALTALDWLYALLVEALV